MSTTAKFECPEKSTLPCDSYGLRAYCACHPSEYVTSTPAPWKEYVIARKEGPWINAASDQIGAVPSRTNTT